MEEVSRVNSEGDASKVQKDSPSSSVTETGNDKDNKVSSEQGGADNRGLMLVVGPGGVTSKAVTFLGKINKTEVVIRATEEIGPDNAGQWKNQDISYILFVMDAADASGLSKVYDQLAYLEKNYLSAFDRMDFIILTAKKPDGKEVMAIKPEDVIAFVAKFGRPLITIDLDGNKKEVTEMGESGERGGDADVDADTDADAEWEEETLLLKQMEIFLQRFQQLTQ